MNVAVLGAGAMGALFGASPAQAGHRVVLVDVRADQVAAIQERGLLVERDGAQTTRSHIVVGTTTVPSDAVGLAHVRTRGASTTKIMSADGTRKPRLDALAAALTAAGFPGEVSEHVWVRICGARAPIPRELRRREPARSTPGGALWGEPERA